ncbi:MAG: hypothetical protein LOD87_13045 [Planifilum fulgidum]
MKRQMARNFRLRKPTHPFKSPIFRHGLTGDCGLSAARPQRKSVHLFRCVSLPKRASAGAAGPENGAFFRLFLLESREKRVDFFAAGTYNDAYK